VIELTNPLILLLVINSIITILLIFNQNDSSKDLLNVQNSSASAPTNPFEKFTWICLVIQLSLLLIKTKITDF
jgi:preprotein translocase subunit SecG